MEERGTIRVRGDGIVHRTVIEAADGQGAWIPVRAVRSIRLEANAADPGGVTKATLELCEVALDLMLPKEAVGVLILGE